MISYQSSIKDLLNRNQPNLALTSIVMSFLSSIQSKRVQEVYQEFEKFIFNLEKLDEKLTISPIITLLDNLLDYWNVAEAADMIIQILTGFKEKLPLLSWEISFFNRLINSYSKSDLTGDGKDDGKISLDIHQTSEQDTLLLQQANILYKDIKNKSTEFARMEQKRSKMVRTYYSNIFQDLSVEKYQDAKDKYIKLAKRMARRNDFETASMMILFAGLAENQAKIPLKQIKSNLDELMNSLGIVKNILFEQLGIKVIYFLIDALNYQDLVIKEKINEILKLLPILEEEKVLIP